MSARIPVIAVVVGAVLASATLLAPWRWPPGDVAAALYLFCFAPGHLLVGAWLRDATTVERLALAVGASLALSVFVGAVTMSPAHHEGLLKATRAAFLVFAFACLAGTAASLARGRRKRPV